jgi:hypothetical protein
MSENFTNITVWANTIKKMATCVAVRMSSAGGTAPMSDKYFRSHEFQHRDEAVKSSSTIADWFDLDVESPICFSSPTLPASTNDQ